MVAPGGMHGCMRGCSRGGGMHRIWWDTEIRSMSRRYASYWNAFLFNFAIGCWRRSTVMCAWSVPGTKTRSPYRQAKEYIRYTASLMAYSHCRTRIPVLCRNFPLVQIPNQCENFCIVQCSDRVWNLSLKACSHRVKANSKAKKIKEQSEEIKKLSSKHQR